MPVGGILVGGGGKVRVQGDAVWGRAVDGTEGS